MFHLICISFWYRTGADGLHVQQRRKLHRGWPHFCRSINSWWICAQSGKSCRSFLDDIKIFPPPQLYTIVLFSKKNCFQHCYKKNSKILDLKSSESRLQSFTFLTCLLHAFLVDCWVTRFQKGNVHFCQLCSYSYLVLKKVEEIKKLKIGDPLDRSTDHGPQNHK